MGRPPKQPLNLWGDGTTSLITTPLNDRELEEAFAAGMIFLQSYPLEDVGGVDRVLQLAYDFAAKREAEQQQAASSYSMPTAAGLSARFRNTVWRTPAPKPIPEADEDTDEDESDESEEDDDDKPLALSRQSLGSRLATTVWKGITNQSALEPPPTPDASPAPSPAPGQTSFPESQVEGTTTSRPASTLWDYAAKVRDSDAAATLAKVSTNWRVKALDAWGKRNSGSGNATSPPSTANPDALSPSWIPHATAKHASLEVPNVLDQRRSSLPTGHGSDSYAPPPRPAFFKPVRDSFIGGVDLRPDIVSPTGSDYSAFSENDVDRFRHQARANTLAALSRTSSPSSAKPTGPKPLLLGSVGSVVQSRSSTLPSNALDKQFADAVRAKRPSLSNRGSQSSASSLSPQDQYTSLSRARTPESAGPSRLVPLNRTVSPMAAARARRQESVSSAASSPISAQRRLPTGSSTEGETTPAVSTRDSVSTVDSVASPPPPPHIPEESSSGPRVAPSEAQRGSVVISEFGEVTDTPAPEVTPRKKQRNLTLQLDDSSDSSAAAPHRTSRVRSKRFPSRLATLRAKHEGKEGRVSPVDRAPSPNTLQAPEFHEEPEATTPKATSFDQTGPLSRRPRKISSDGKGRKVSSERAERKHKRESAAAEGDDEGYDELLSAYESEDLQ